MISGFVSDRGAVAIHVDDFRLEFLLQLVDVRNDLVRDCIVARRSGL